MLGSGHTGSLFPLKIMCSDEFLIRNQARVNLEKASNVAIPRMSYFCWHYVSIVRSARPNVLFVPSSICFEKLDKQQSRVVCLHFKGHIERKVRVIHFGSQRAFLGLDSLYVLKMSFDLIFEPCTSRIYKTQLHRVLVTLDVSFL